MGLPLKILYVSSEIIPFSEENMVSLLGRYLPQASLEDGFEIRAFMPKYGNINERKNQLHEVIRLSGMNLTVGEIDRPLTIKVASIPSTRIQVYFIDNEDYFKRRSVFTDDDGTFFKDNDERAILFARGTLETVKKLRWQPKIVHCNGWISNLIPLYLKKEFKTDPIFTDAKVVVTLYNEFLKEKFNSSFAKKVLTQNLKPENVELLKNATVASLAKLAVQYADGVVLGSKEMPKDITDFIAKSKTPSISCPDVTTKNIESMAAKYLKFYRKFI